MMERGTLPIENMGKSLQDTRLDPNVEFAEEVRDNEGEQNWDMLQITHIIFI